MSQRSRSRFWNTMFGIVSELRMTCSCLRKRKYVPHHAHAGIVRREMWTRNLPELSQMARRVTTIRRCMNPETPTLAARISKNLLQGNSIVKHNTRGIQYRLRLSRIEFSYLFVPESKLLNQHSIKSLKIPFTKKYLIRCFCSTLYRYMFELGVASGNSRVGCTP